MKTTTIDLPSLSVRAAVSSVNESRRTVDVVWSTGSSVDRTDWSGKRYREVLSMNPAHVRLDRLNSGAPLLDSHSAYSISSVIGVVESGTARIAGGQGVATIRFSQRDDVEAIWQDVVDGIIGAVSVAYRTHKVVEDTPKDGSTPTRTAIDWEPFEISMVSMPADPGAKVRANTETNVCEIVDRAETDEGGGDQDDDERTASEAGLFEWGSVPDVGSDRACEVRGILAEFWGRGEEPPAAVCDEFVNITVKHTWSKEALTRTRPYPISTTHFQAEKELGQL